MNSALSPLTSSASRLKSDSAELGAALRRCRTGLLAVAVFSIVINLLSLAGSIFMIEVYNRVLPSRSIPTLVVLALLTLTLLLGQGLLELIRSRLLVRIGNFLHDQSRHRAFSCTISLPIRFGSAGAALNPIKDLDAIRAFLSSQGPAALCDLPWIPFYIAVLFLFHPYLGLVALAGGLLVASLAMLTEVLTRRSVDRALAASVERDSLLDVNRRNVETLHALGMRASMEKRWSAVDDAVVNHQRQASDVALGFSSASRTLRLVIQSAVLGVGAVLVIQQEATGGLMMASAILAARALAPIDVAIANWRGFIGARQSWKRLRVILSIFPAAQEPLALAAPRSRLDVTDLSVAPPGVQALAVQKVTFALKGGDVLAIVGPSASGKSSLARALIGAWPPVAGTIRLDGASIEHWGTEALGKHIGYLPQRVELFPGTIAQNVARFDPNASSAAIVKAAEAAQVHDLILSLPDGYATLVGQAAGGLSAGQQQRIALSRALYGDPFFVILDEPNSNLDVAGETALVSALHSIRSRGGIAVVITHRQSVLTAVNRVLILFAGQVEKFGTKDEILRQRSRTGAVRHAG